MTEQKVPKSANVAPSMWLDYLEDILEWEDNDPNIASYAAPTGKPSVDYFRQPRYPYPQRLSLPHYLKENYALQVELVKLQNWIQERSLRVLLIFEGRDTAGKGTSIKNLVDNLNPRHVRVVALNKPTESEQSQWYFQRYTRHLPSAGEIVLFDRSWYNRAGVERVMNFCTEEEYWQFVQQAPLFEKMLVETGIVLVKFYLSISKEEQARRILERKTNPLKRWKLSPIDQQAQDRWDAYSDAKEETLRRTASTDAPWTIVKADDKLRARLTVARFVLSRFEYEGKDRDAIGEIDPLLVEDAASIYPPADN